MKETKDPSYFIPHAAALIPAFNKETRMFKEFREFIKRGNVMDLAVAVVLAAAFGKIVTTLVEGVIMPPIGLLLGKMDFASLFYNLSDKPVASLAEAKAAGVPVIAYGQFINDIINFLIIALVVFLIVRQVNRMKSKQATDAGPTTKDCPFCLSTIPLKATRCKDCTSELKAA
jgi:large conductance mechanosensitive channel